jgi:hypothetical protein
LITPACRSAWSVNENGLYPWCLRTRKASLPPPLSRREFLRRSAAAFAIPMVVPASVLGARSLAHDLGQRGPPGRQRCPVRETAHAQHPFRPAACFDMLPFSSYVSAWIVNTLLPPRPTIKDVARLANVSLSRGIDRARIHRGGTGRLPKAEWDRTCSRCRAGVILRLNSRHEPS